MSTNAVEELVRKMNGTDEKERESAILRLSGLMTNAPVSREQVRQRPVQEPVEEDEDKEIVRKALELYERDPAKFKEMVMSLNDGPLGIQLSHSDKLTGTERDAAVMSLANMAQKVKQNG